MWSFNKRGINPMVAIVLMVTVTVILASLMYMVVAGTDDGESTDVSSGIAGADAGAWAIGVMILAISVLVAVIVLAKLEVLTDNGDLFPRREDKDDPKPRRR